VRPFVHIYRDIGRFCLSLLAALSLVPVCSSQLDSPAQSEILANPYLDADAYSIYAALLESQHHPLIVIQAETESLPGVTPDNLGIKGDRNFDRVWRAVLKDFAKQYANPKLLTRNIPTEVAYELVPRQKIEAFFKSEGKWNAFYELYPSSGGYYWFSAVGFDPQKAHAIVRMNHLCGGLCGGGEPHFFEKKNGKWREVSVHAEVTVWAS